MSKKSDTLIAASRASEPSAREAARRIGQQTNPKPVNKSLMRKRASRLAAAQALYSEALMEKKTIPALMVAQILESWVDSKANDAADLPHATQPEVALLNRIIDAAAEHAAPIETAIDALILPGWSKARTSLPLLAVLRAFAAELLAQPDRAAAMLVDEYTEVAAQLVTDEELQYAHKAFNLLLGALRPAHG